MEETVETTVSIWNKKMQDLTVKDQVIISIASLGVVVGSMAVIGTVGALFGKIRDRKVVETISIVEPENVENNISSI